MLPGLAPLTRHTRYCRVRSLSDSQGRFALGFSFFKTKVPYFLLNASGIDFNVKKKKQLPVSFSHLFQVFFIPWPFFARLDSVV